MPLAHSFLHRCLQKSKCILKSYLGTISLLANACVSKRQFMVQCKRRSPTSNYARKYMLKVGLRQLDCDECVLVKYSQNIKDQPPLTAEHIIESGAFVTMDTVPEHQRVYKSCVYPVACVIVVMYVSIITACVTTAGNYLQNFKQTLLRMDALTCTVKVTCHHFCQ